MVSAASSRTRCRCESAQAVIAAFDCPGLAENRLRSVCDLAPLPLDSGKQIARRRDLLLAGGRRLTPMLQARIQPVFERAQEMVETSSAATRWQPDQFPLLVLAMYHVFVGYFNIASLYQDMNGQDLLAEEALAKQALFYADLVEALFAEEGPGEGR